MREITNADLAGHQYAQDHTDCPVCSPLKCEMCGAPIAEDKDPDYLVEEFWTADGDKDAILCAACRETHIEALD